MGEYLMIRKEGGARRIGDRIVGGRGLEGRRFDERKIGTPQAIAQGLIADMMVESCTMPGSQEIDIGSQENRCSTVAAMT